WSPATTLVVFLRPVPFVQSSSWHGSLPDQGGRTELSRRQPDRNRLPCDSPLTTLLFLCTVGFFGPHLITSEGIQFEFEKWLQRKSKDPGRLRVTHAGSMPWK